MKSMISMMAVFGAYAASAAAVVSNVSVSQGAGNRVTISYDLSADAIVTCSVETNAGSGVWVAIPEDHLMALSGAVNRKVAGGSGREIVWKPARDFRGSGIASANVRAKVKAWELFNPPDYMVVDLVTPNTINYYVSTNALPGGIGDIRYRKEKLLMRHIHAAGETFRMGSSIAEKARENTHKNWNETPHLVSFTEDYWIGVFELTYGQMRAGALPTYAGKLHTDDVSDADFPCYPVEYTTGNYFYGSGDEVGSNSLCKKMRDVCGIALGLPTEAQWEFAARAGETLALPNGRIIYDNVTSSNSLNEIAWNLSNSNGTTHPVGKLAPNNWGLYDVIGNVREACRDGALVTMTTAHVTDPFVSVSGLSGRVVRGGGYRYNAQNDRSAFRSSRSISDCQEDEGFRLYAPCPAD